ncbi:MAG: family 20 glycosylhydrolase [Rhodococcus sp. (in: high G+C Gram-positive bacteria)]|uniref:beta-N-acetylhexosaminidase n=1 Tax=Rhodococcus sp. TaxID=1831 RepID=UPI003BB78937
MYSIIPLPARVEATAGDPVCVRAGDTVTWSDPVLDALAGQFVQDVERACGLRLETGRVGLIELVLADEIPGLDMLPATRGVSPTDGDPADERYRLRVGNGRIRIAGTRPEGIFRGLTTLIQMIGVIPDGADSVALDPIEIHDAPRYAWRGLSLDVVRRFMPTGEVTQVIDQLARFKMNVLHLHLTDNEGWRLEITERPRLTEIGGSTAAGERPGGFYTQQQYRELVDYAADRFVTVVPEIDMPGHAAAAIASYPELLPGGGSPADPSSSALDPAVPGTMDFVRAVLTEVAALTPGAYLHAGGDEVFGMDDEVYRRFMTEAQTIVRELGKKLVSWQEAARAGVSAGSVSQYWMNSDLDTSMLSNAAEHGIDIPAEFLPSIEASLRQARGDVTRALASGAVILLSPSSLIYLDNPYTEPGPADQEDQRARLGMRLYPGNTVESAVDWDPLDVHTDIDSDDTIAGVEAALWCETVDRFEDAQFLMQPRLAGAAERAWAPAGPFDWSDYAVRLAGQAPLWRRDGWDFFRSASVEWT